jgi:hypothetical protein
VNVRRAALAPRTGGWREDPAEEERTGGWRQDPAEEERTGGWRQDPADEEKKRRLTFGRAALALRLAAGYGLSAIPFNEAALQVAGHHPRRHVPPVPGSSGCRPDSKKPGVERPKNAHAFRPRHPGLAAPPRVIWTTKTKMVEPDDAPWARTVRRRTLLKPQASTSPPRLSQSPRDGYPSTSFVKRYWG